MTDPTKFMTDFKKFLKELTDEELNKRLHEILNLCWHDWNKAMYQNVWKCSLCEITKDTVSVPSNIDFLTWEGFGVLWEWLQEQDLLDNFLHNKKFNPNLINPRALAEVVVEFFKEEK